ncbi:MAG: hypothetical protein AB8I08_00660 [Sandaracinaceae bacterium]
MSSTKAASVALTALMLVHCAPTSAGEEETLGIECSGKCDGIGSNIRSVYRAAGDVDLGDLLSVTSGLASDGLNDALAFDNAAVEVEAPELYAVDPGPDELTLNDLTVLTSGLTERYGDRELTTVVNRARRDHLESSGDIVFAEAAFSVRAGVDPNWRFDAGGLGEGDAAATVGFTANATLESRVIAAFDRELEATTGSILSAAQETRGFVLPRDVQDLRAMKPGESFALSGSGAVGINVGAGVPLLVAQPASAITYQLVLSAALRTRIEGQLDVQLVRLPGGEVVVDVGTSEARSRLARLALSDGWGVSGLTDVNLNLAGFDVDLGRAVDRALQSQLNDKLSLIEASVERSGRRSRVSVARFRFDLDAMGPDAEQALTQALRGDVRLAQALAGQSEPGVVSELDLLRSGVSATSSAGVEILGMRFFRREVEESGTTIVQTPGGARSLMFESLHRDRGWFFSSHGFTRVGLAGLVFDPSNPGRAEGEANLFVEIVEGDEFMERDRMLDHIDAMIVALAGPDALAAIEGPGNALERYVETQCSPSSGPGADCREDVLADPQVVSLRAEGVAALEAASSGLDADQRAMLMAAGALRMTAQATVEPAASLVGPNASVVMGYRLDDRSLGNILLEHSGGDLEEAVYRYLEAIEVDRGDTADRIAQERNEARRTDLSALGIRFEAAAERYESLLAVESSRIDGLGTIGANAIEILVPVDRDRGVQYEEATAQSIARARVRVLTGLFDGLREDSRRIGRHPEAVAAYGLLSLVDEDARDVRLNIDMDLDDRFAQDYDHYRAAGYGPLDVYARGAGVDTIDGGLFSLDALLTVD